MAKTYAIHPGIGISRLGNSTTSFCIAPEVAKGVPIDCDDRGNAWLGPDGTRERSIEHYKDAEGRIRRQAARFFVCVHDDEHPGGRPLKLGDPIEGGGNVGTLVDIQWRVYLANKKSSWYEFSQLEGEHGYAGKHPRRNAKITDRAARQRLIIDPGPQAVDHTTRRRASLSRDGNPSYTPVFPPPLKPASIDTLGEILTDDTGRLLVLGGHGNSGSLLEGFEDPVIRSYSNNDGWFDDTSDGPVMARLKFHVPSIDSFRFIDVEGPAWVIVGYPAYVPEISDLVTMEDVLDDVAIRDFAADAAFFGAPPFDQKVDTTDPKALERWKAQELQFNPQYRPWFHRDIWPILSRPFNFTWLTQVLYGSNFPHDESDRGTFYKEPLGVVPKDGKDEYGDARRYLYDLLRQPGEENQFRKLDHPNSRLHNLPLMPLLAGDNPLTNTLPSKFLRLTDTQFFILKQWAAGCFLNERDEWPCVDGPDEKTGWSLDHGVMANVLGGAFCPGGEVGWVMRNPSIFRAPYKVKADPGFYAFGQTAANAYRKPELEYAYLQSQELAQDDDFETGLQPGDLTKHMALPWQADFNECSTQVIDVTYESWNVIYPDNPEDPRMKSEARNWETLWWPAHRPMQTFVYTGESGGSPQYAFVDWAKGLPATNEGDLKMVTSWSRLGFVVKNPHFQGNRDEPYESWEDPGSNPRFIAVEGEELP